MFRRLRRKPQLRITNETAEVFARLAGKLRKSGRDRNPRINDLWLAAQAVQRGFRLLTANPKDFRDVPELQSVAIKLPPSS
jgi:predicted nucleic acid-binding protein